MTLFAVTLIMALIWTAVTGSFTLLNLGFGFVLSMLVLGLLRERIDGVGYVTRTWRFLSLVLLFLVELMKSAWKVAVMVMSPNMNLQPGVFAFPLTVKTDFEITLLANLITLTPGTLSVDVSEDRSILYVHAVDCSDVEGTIRDIADGFERKILETFE